ncbi:hypothetical protein GCM10009430_08830 [Aquimarina litoralis]|uniref:DUF4393 domain-containing protein n=1 Tax=Aquimarina litoralis TaxID=584605 RepID=A0ABP3TTL0_9FLAO
MDEKSQIEIAKGIGQAAEKALDFIEKIVAGPIMEGTGIFTDKVKYWRFKNQVNIITKARGFLKSKGIEIPKKIPIKDVSTLLEFASFEEEEIMQDGWAKLLANTMNPNNRFDACHLFSQVLNQISVNEFYILTYLNSRSFILTSNERPYLEKNDLIRNSHSDYHTGILLIDNLLRLRLIEEEPPKFKDNSNYNSIYSNFDKLPENEIIASDSFRISKFGAELIKQITE